MGELSNQFPSSKTMLILSPPKIRLNNRRMQRGFIIFKQFITLFILFSFSTSLVFGQKTPVQAKSPTCSGAWTGTITYTRTQKESDSKTVDRVSGRGQDTRDWQLNLDYKASVTVFEPPQQAKGTSVGKASITHSYSTTEKTLAFENNSCDKGKTFRGMSGTFTNRVEISGSGSGDANVSIGVNSDGTYTVGVGLPEIQGETKGYEKASYTGQCTAKEGRNSTMPPTPTRIKGNSFCTDGTHRVDPSNPNRISGRYLLNTLGITETLTWSLQRCGGDLQITDITFEDMKFPNWNDWQEAMRQNRER
jgi:hypothetical protein